MKLGNWVIYELNSDGTIRKTGLVSRRHAFKELFDGAIAIRKVRGLTVRAVVENGWMPKLKEFENDFPCGKSTWNWVTYFLFTGVVISILLNLYLIYRLV